MQLIDVHCHLDDPRYEGNLDEIIKKAKNAKVKHIITSGVNPPSNRKVLEISKKYQEIVKCSFGLYPIDSILQKIDKSKLQDYPRNIDGFDPKKELDWIRQNKDSCVAIGEVGLDYKILPDEKNHQKKVFEAAIDLALELDKPLVIHSRKAELECIEILEKKGCKKVVMHCFSGKKSLIKRCAENGWFLSIPAVITRLEHFQMMAKIVPLKNLLTETDGPYLAPTAGELSKPSDIAGTIKEIAKIKNTSEEEVAITIFNNARELFKL